MRELFIYYRVRNADATRVRKAVVAMQDELRAGHPALHTRLLIRQGEGDGPQTWMETYSGGSGSAGIDAAVEALIEAHAKRLAPFIDGARHIEAFDADSGI